MKMRRYLILFLLITPLVAQDAGDARKEYKKRKSELSGSKDAAEWVKLGDFCLENKFKNDAKFCYKRAHTFDPDVAGAVEGMKKLSYVLDGKAWNHASEILRKKKRKVARADLDGRFALTAWALEYGLTREADKDLKSIIKANPYHRKSRLALGYKYGYGEWWTEKALEVEKKIDDAFEKALKEKKTAAEIFEAARAAGYKGSLKEVERIAKFSSAPRGTHKDVKLEYQKDKYPGEYTYGVPGSYKPWRKNTIIIFLHGGGAGVGDGDTYFPQIWPKSGPRGFITVCPTVLNKVVLAWNNRRHVDYIRAIVHEMQQKYNINPDRMYLMGHSMGGFGCFFIGTQTTDIFAAISPWSGGPGGGLNNLRYTPTYIIHGKDDSVVSVAGSRRAAKTLKKLKYPVVYVEINGHNHAVPFPEQVKAVEWISQFRLTPQAKAGKKR